MLHQDSAALLLGSKQRLDDDDDDDDDDEEEEEESPELSSDPLPSPSYPSRIYKRNFKTVRKLFKRMTQ